MSKLPWFQFFPGDWLKDPKLSMCQPATRGIWIDIISAAHELRSGTLTGTPDQLARICRCTVPDLCLALTDLATTGTADIRWRDGIVSITCRRLAREQKDRESARERIRKHRNKEKPLHVTNCNGSVTGSNCLEYNDLSANPNDCNADVTEMFLLTSDFSNKDLNIKENIREETLEEKGGCGGKRKPKKPPPSLFDEFFNEFMEAFPRNEGRTAAEKAFKKLKPDRALLDEMLLWLEKAKQSQQWQDKTYIPHAAKWLNEERWKDDPPPLPVQARGPTRASPTAAFDVKTAALNAEIAVAETEAVCEIRPPPEPPEEWKSALGAIRQKIGDSSFDTWISPVTCLGIESGVLKLAVPTETFRTVLFGDFAPLLLSSANAKEIQIHCRTGGGVYG